MLQPATRNDRRARFAQITLSRADGADATVLVADARGRMRYPLADGHYQLSLRGGPQVRFTVRDHRWTTIRLELI